METAYAAAAAPGAARCRRKRGLSGPSSWPLCPPRHSMVSGSGRSRRRLRVSGEERGPQAPFAGAFGSRRLGENRGRAGSRPLDPGAGAALRLPHPRLQCVGRSGQLWRREPGTGTSALKTRNGVRDGALQMRGGGRGHLSSRQSFRGLGVFVCRIQAPAHCQAPKCIRTRGTVEGAHQKT